jgi:hypothetical protein
LTPFILSKAAVVAEINSDMKSALKYTKRIKKDFPASAESANADVLIAYYEAKISAQ